MTTPGVVRGIKFGRRNVELRESDGVTVVSAQSVVVGDSPGNQVVQFPKKFGRQRWSRAFDGGSSGSEGVFAAVTPQVVTPTRMESQGGHMNARTSGTYRRSLAALRRGAARGTGVGHRRGDAAANHGFDARHDGAQNRTRSSRVRCRSTDRRYDEAVTVLLGPVSRAELQGADLRDARIVLARAAT